MWHSKLRVEVMRQQIEQDIKNNRLRYRAALEIQTATEPFDGKQINTRIATAIQARLSGWSVHYGIEHVQLWSNSEGLPFDRRLDIRLAKNVNTLRFDYSKFVNDTLIHYLTLDAKANAAQEMLSRLPKLIADYNAAIDQMEAARNAFGPVSYLVQ